MLLEVAAGVVGGIGAYLIGRRSLRKELRKEQEAQSRYEWLLRVAQKREKALRASNQKLIDRLVKYRRRIGDAEFIEELGCQHADTVNGMVRCYGEGVHKDGGHGMTYCTDLGNGLHECNQCNKKYRTVEVAIEEPSSGGREAIATERFVARSGEYIYGWLLLDAVWLVASAMQGRSAQGSTESVAQSTTRPMSSETLATCFSWSPQQASSRWPWPR